MPIASYELIETEAHTRFTVDEYFRMSDAGVFANRKVELIGGRIYEMPAQGPPHRLSITLITIVLARFFGDVKRYWPVFQGTMPLDKYDAPEPDFHVFDVPAGTPDVELPPPILVIEVSHSTVRKDRGVKLSLYAEVGVPEYWIVNIESQEVEVYRSPRRESGAWHYAEVRHFKRGESMTILDRPDIVIAVDEILAHA